MYLDEDYKKHQLLIDAKLADYEKKMKKLEVLEIEITFDTLLEIKNRNRPNQTVAEYFEIQVEHLKTSGKFNTASKYECTFVSLQKFRSMNIVFNKIDFPFLRDYELFLRKSGVGNNTIATRFATLKAIYNKALADGVFKSEDNPFRKYKVGSLWTKTRKRAINKEDVLKLKELDLSQSNSFYLHFACDVFLFSYYTAGMNFKDIATLRYADIENDRVYYSRSKTNKEMSCFLMPEAKQIVEKYSFPFNSSDDYIFPILNRRIHISEQQRHNRIHKALAKVNANLKTLSTMIGLETPLTTYVARHTYATVLKRSGVNIAIISESLGHSEAHLQNPVFTHKFWRF
jgi:site-specific recombinase XerD